MAINISREEMDAICFTLEDKSKTVTERFRSLFTLKNLGGKQAIDSISKCFDDQSVLLKHECAYCLGQMQDEYAIGILITVLEDEDQDKIVRHEAGEALGAIGNPSVLDVLQKYVNDPVREVAETCQLAVERINWLMNVNKENIANGDTCYTSVDPAPPSEITDIRELKSMLLNEKLPLFLRYRAMFSLRNDGSEEAISALVTGFECDGALFKHEIAYVLGQMQPASAELGLLDRLKDLGESPMVRHECAEAMGSIASDSCFKALFDCLNDEEVIVRQSCEVGLDMAEYGRSEEEFEYANGLAKLKNEKKVDL